MNISLFTIHVKDIQKSIDFYRNIFKMEIIRDFKPNENMRLVFLKGEGGTSIELVEDSSHMPKVSMDPNVAMGVFVEDINAVVDIMRNNDVKIKNGPFETPNGTKLLFAEDPDGVVLEFIEEKK